MSDPLVADLVDEAGRRGAYGALIAAAREAWASHLREKYGIPNGAWEIPLTEEINRQAERIRELEGIIKRLLRDAPLAICENMHHRKTDQGHDMFDDCPVVKRWEQACAAAEAAAGEG